MLLSCPVQQKNKKLHYSTLRYITVKLLKTKLKEKYLKAAREKLLSTGIQRHEGLLIRNNWSCFTSGHGGHTVLISEARSFPLGEGPRDPQPGPAQAMLPVGACHSPGLVAATSDSPLLPTARPGGMARPPGARPSCLCPPHPQMPSFLWSATGFRI